MVTQGPASHTPGHQPALPRSLPTPPPREVPSSLAWERGDVGSAPHTLPGAPDLQNLGLEVRAGWAEVDRGLMTASSLCRLKGWIHPISSAPVPAQRGERWARRQGRRLRGGGSAGRASCMPSALGSQPGKVSETCCPR